MRQFQPLANQNEKETNSKERKKKRAAEKLDGMDSAPTTNTSSQEHKGEVEEFTMDSGKRKKGKEKLTSTIQMHWKVRSSIVHVRISRNQFL